LLKAKVKVIVRVTVRAIVRVIVQETLCLDFQFAVARGGNFLNQAEAIDELDNNINNTVAVVVNVLSLDAYVIEKVPS